MYKYTRQARWMSVVGRHSCAQRFDIYRLMLLTATTAGREQPRAVCLAEQTWAELSTHGHADRSLDGPIINLLSPLCPASDWLSDWNNTTVIFAFRGAMQLYYSHVILHVAWTDTLSVSRSSDIWDWMWQIPHHRVHKHVYCTCFE